MRKETVLCKIDLLSQQFPWPDYFEAGTYNSPCTKHGLEAFSRGVWYTVR